MRVGVERRRTPRQRRRRDSRRPDAQLPARGRPHHDAGLALAGGPAVRRRDPSGRTRDGVCAHGAARRRSRSKDAVFNLQRALLLVRALESGEYDHLREALRRSLASAGPRAVRARPGRGAGARSPVGARRVPERRRAVDRRASPTSAPPRRPSLLSGIYHEARRAVYDQNARRPTSRQAADRA